MPRAAEHWITTPRDGDESRRHSAVENRIGFVVTWKSRVQFHLLYLLLSTFHKFYEAPSVLVAIDRRVHLPDRSPTLAPSHSQLLNRNPSTAIHVPDHPSSQKASPPNRPLLEPPLLNLPCPSPTQTHKSIKTSKWQTSRAMAPMKETNNKRSSSNYGEDVVRKADVLASCYLVDSAGQLQGLHYCTTSGHGMAPFPDPFAPR